MRQIKIPFKDDTVCVYIKMFINTVVYDIYCPVDKIKFYKNDFVYIETGYQKGHYSIDYTYVSRVCYYGEHDFEKTYSSVETDMWYDCKGYVIKELSEIPEWVGVTFEQCDKEHDSLKKRYLEWTDSDTSDVLKHDELVKKFKKENNIDG